MSASDTDQITAVPAPWTLKGTVYAFMFYQTSSHARTIPSSLLYDPLEASASFSAERPLGGLSMVQIIRYTDSPVGPYDEMVIVPGSFGYVAKDGKRGSAPRITRIYVSQKGTCYNGRKNWNIPKSLATFRFTDSPSGSITISVTPHSWPLSPTARPFFSTTFQPVHYAPTFPISTSLAKYFFYDLSVVQPPLPEGDSAELPGTELWRKILPVISSRKAKAGWFDLRQFHASDGSQSADQAGLLSSEGVTDTSVEEGRSFENWFPGWGRWKLGFRMEDAVFEFSEGECWTIPRPAL